MTSAEERTATDREIQMSGFKKRPIILPLIALLAFVVAGGHPARAQTLNAVKERGSSIAASAKGCWASLAWTTRMRGPALTSIFVAPLRRRSLAIPQK